MNCWVLDYKPTFNNLVFPNHIIKKLKILLKMIHKEYL